MQRPPSDISFLLAFHLPFLPLSPLYFAPSFPPSFIFLQSYRTYCVSGCLFKLERIMRGQQVRSRVLSVIKFVFHPDLQTSIQPITNCAGQSVFVSLFQAMWPVIFDWISCSHVACQLYLRDELSSKFEDNMSEFLTHGLEFLSSYKTLLLSFLCSRFSEPSGLEL